VDSAVNGNKVTALMKPRVVKRQKINKKIYNLSGSGKCYKNKSHGLREWGGSTYYRWEEKKSLTRWNSSRLE
jgi:hypothetical protein